MSPVNRSRTSGASSVPRPAKSKDRIIQQMWVSLSVSAGRTDKTATGLSWTSHRGTRYQHREDSFGGNAVTVAVLAKVIEDVHGNLKLELPVPMPSNVIHNIGASGIPKTVTFRLDSQGSGTVELKEDHPSRYVTLPKLRLYARVQVARQDDRARVTALTLDATATQFSDRQSGSKATFHLSAQLS